MLTYKDKTTADPEGGVLTRDEVATYLKAGKRAVYRLAAEGTLPGFKLGGTWRFRRSDLDHWVMTNLNNKNRGHATDGTHRQHQPLVGR
ncbi:helix-turn-helix domain-containing protein [Castellaniella hirudinis]|uniref:helix-turn-helix domain-containing protein n=1 Tax=Castellaniella hirudinis TaxID=1144617 RepID=UPI0039C2A001